MKGRPDEKGTASVAVTVYDTSITLVAMPEDTFLTSDSSFVIYTTLSITEH